MTSNCAEIRLELVKLCYRHDHDAEKITEKAKGLERYVLKESEQSTRSVSKKTRRKT